MYEKKVLQATVYAERGRSFAATSKWYVQGGNMKWTPKTYILACEMFSTERYFCIDAWFEQNMVSQ